MKSKIILLSLLFAVLGCTVKKSASYTELEPVSMIQLINNPDKYDGKKVEIRGYFISAFEESVIYLNKIDYDIGNAKNGIWLSVSKEFIKSQDINPPYKGYISVDGIFLKNKKKINSSYSGTLTKIDFMSRIISKSND